MTNLIWLHEDALRADHPVFSHAGGNAHACFIWDDAYLQKMDYGFKRLVFIYETLCELPVKIYHGDTAEILKTLCAQHNAHTLYIPETPNPELQAIYQSLSELSMEVISDDPFVVLKKETELKRFFRYWNKAKKPAMQKDGGIDA